MNMSDYFTVVVNIILMVLIIIALFLAFLYMVYGSEGEREKEKAYLGTLSKALSLFTKF